MQEVETNPFRQILKALAEVHEFIQRNSVINQRRFASRQKISARKYRNERIGNFPQRKNAWLARTSIGIPNFIHETDQN